MRTCVLLMGLFAMAVPAACLDLDAFSYPDTETAQQHWQPQFGSKPVRVETLPDGSTCLALDAEFAKANDRGCWDWTANIDLSGMEQVCFDISAEGAGGAGNVGTYFGTPGGWYAKFWWWGAPDSWTPRTLLLSEFGAEDTPSGWDKVTTFRFSIWASGPGKVTYRLRNMRVEPRDTTANLIKNGSFEIPGVGVPYGWGSGHWGVGDLPWAADMDLWRAHWYLDEGAAVDGKKSLCIDNTADLPRLRAMSVWLSPPKNVDGLALSAWMKSDQEALPVTMSFGGKSTKAQVGREWQQVSLVQIQTGAQSTVVIAPEATGKLWIDAVQLQPREEPTAEYVQGMQDAGIIARESQVDWSAPRRVAQVAQGRSIEGEITDTKVGVDEHGRFILNGKPYIQHSLGLEFVSDLAVLEFAAKSGFSDVCCQIRESLTTEELKAIFDKCAQVGMRIIPWLDGRISRERFAEHISTLRNHPALLCWYVYDEPSGDRFAEADYRYKLARELDPDHPALINYLGNKLEGHMGDIYSTDIYPIPHSSPGAAVAGVKAMTAAAAKENKPVWMWLQGTGYAYWMDREPSPRELSCMVYGSLLEGARGIYYFAQIPRTRECFDEMRAMCIEVEALTPALSSLDQAPDMTHSEDAVMCKPYALGDEVWVLAVNTRNSAVSCEFSLATGPDDAEVVFEGRQVSVSDGSWKDDFGAYERHVYRLSGK